VRNFHLLLAVFWLFLGAMLLLVPRFYPEAPDLTIRGIDISAGWVAVVLALYNVVRWWALLASARGRARNDAGARRPMGRHPTPHHRPGQEPNPAFDFTKPPPPKDTDARGKSE
jgi:hypothetical protein